MDDDEAASILTADPFADPIAPEHTVHSELSPLSYGHRRGD